MTGCNLVDEAFHCKKCKTRCNDAESIILQVSFHSLQPIEIKLDCCRVYETGTAFDGHVPGIAIQSVAQGRNQITHPLVADVKKCTKGGPFILDIFPWIMPITSLTRLMGSPSVNGPRET